VAVEGAPSSIGPTTIIGVMAQGFSFPFQETLWVPLVRTPSLQKREARSLWFAFGRMADGVSIDAARAELDTIGRRLASAYPLTNQDIRPGARAFHEFWGGANATVTYGSMWGAVGFVLLIAAANLANLLLARAISRSREISIRIALAPGAGGSSANSCSSLMISAGRFRRLVDGLGVRTCSPAGGYQFRLRDGLPRAGLSHGDFGRHRLLFGVAPASRLSKLDVNSALKLGGRGATGSRGRLSALLVIGEMALAVVLLAAAGVMIRSFLKVYTANLGVSTANILTMSVTLPAATYPGAEARISFHDRLRARLEAVPGVESIAFTSTQPTGFAPTLPYELAGALPVDAQRRPTLPVLTISPDYFRTLGAAVLAGREFTDADGASGVPVVIVNHRFATALWPGRRGRQASGSMARRRA
jgi:hypothetical protein